MFCECWLRTCLRAGGRGKSWELMWTGLLPVTELFTAFCGSQLFPSARHHNAKPDTTTCCFSAIFTALTTSCNLAELIHAKECSGGDGVARTCCVSLTLARREDVWSPLLWVWSCWIWPGSCEMNYCMLSHLALSVCLVYWGLKNPKIIFFWQSLITVRTLKTVLMYQDRPELKGSWFYWLTQSH